MLNSNLVEVVVEVEVELGNNPTKINTAVKFGPFVAATSKSRSDDVISNFPLVFSFYKSARCRKSPL